LEFTKEELPLVLVEVLIFPQRMDSFKELVIATLNIFTKRMDMAMLHRFWPPFPPATDLSTGERGGIHGGRLVNNSLMGDCKPRLQIQVEFAIT